MEVDYALTDAANKIRQTRTSASIMKIVVVCACVVLCCAIICSTFCCIYAIRKQQDAIVDQQRILTDQYNGLLEYVKGTEIVTETEVIDGSDGGAAIKIDGDGNSANDGGN